MVIVTAVGHGLEGFHTQRFLGGSSHRCELLVVGRLVHYLGHHDEFVLGIDGNLPVVTHPHFAHPPTVGIGERDFLFAALCQARQRLLITLLARAQRRDLALHGPALGGGGALRHCRRLRAVARLERGQELREPRVDALNARAQFFGATDLRHVVDGFELGPVDGHQFAAEEFQLAAEQVKLPEDRLESLGIVPAEIGDGLEVGLQLAQQPEHFEIAPAFEFEPAAGAHLVEITPKIELQEIGGRKGRSAGVRRLGAAKPAGRQIEPIDESVQKAHRVLRIHVFLHAFRQEQRLRAIDSKDKGHGFAACPARPREEKSFHTVSQLGNEGTPPSPPCPS